MTRAALWLALALAAAPALAETLPLRPDDRLTPGVVASSDPAVVCTTGAESYSEEHRKTPEALKAAVYAAYGIDHQGREFEIDHRLPLALGGADVKENLWPQQGWRHPSFHDKDRLESKLWRMVCKDRTMPLKTAQAILLGDWIQGFTKLYGQPPR